MVRISIQTNQLLFHEHTAERKKMSEQGKDDQEITFKIVSFPKSIVNKSKI